MPQLDKFTFLDQSLLSLFFFFFVYCINICFILPKISIALKLRLKILNFFCSKNFDLKYNILGFDRFKNLNLELYLSQQKRIIVRTNFILPDAYQNFALLQKFSV